MTCGDELDSVAKFCGGCGTTVGFAPAPAPAAVPAPAPVTAPVPAPVGFVPTGPVAAPSPPAPVVAPTMSAPIEEPRPTIGTFKLAHGEVIKAVFELNRVKRPLGWLDGRVFVTDSRVLYKSEAKNVFNRSRLSQEIALKDVNGMAVTTNKGVSPVGAAAVVALALVGLVGIFLNPFLPILAALAIGLVFLVARTTAVTFVLNAGKSEASPIVVTSGIKDSSANIFVALLRVLVSPLLKVLSALGVMDAAEAVTSSKFDQVNAMYEEMGALILDLQSRGVLADKVS